MSKVRSQSDQERVPALDAEAASGFKERLREIIGDGTMTSFAKRCGFSDSLLGSYVRGEKLPGFENLLAIAKVGGVSLDWIATGRLPKVRSAGSAVSQVFYGPEPYDGRRDMLEAVLRVAEYKISRGEVTRQVIETSLRGAPAWLEAARDYPDLEPRFRTMIATMEFMNAAGEGALDAERRM